MQVKLIPEGIVVDACPAISDMDNLLVKLPDSLVKEKGRRWDSRAKGSYEVLKVENYEISLLRVI